MAFGFVCIATRLIDLCCQAITALRQEGVNVLLVEQNTTRALDVAARICVLASECDVWQGTAQEAGEDPAPIKAYLGLLYFCITVASSVSFSESSAAKRNVEWPVRWW